MGPFRGSAGIADGRDKELRRGEAGFTPRLGSLRRCETCARALRSGGHLLEHLGADVEVRVDLVDVVELVERVE